MLRLLELNRQSGLASLNSDLGQLTLCQAEIFLVNAAVRCSLRSAR